MPMGYRLTQPDWQGIPGGDPSSPYYHTLASEPVVPTGRPPWPRQRQVSENRDPRLAATWATGRQDMEPKPQVARPKGVEHAPGTRQTPDKELL